MTCDKWSFHSFLCVAMYFAVVQIVFCQNDESNVYKLVYENVNVKSYDKCARLMNGTSQIGCQSSSKGDVGILMHINESSQLNELDSAPDPPYVILLHANLFNRPSIKKFKSSGKVSGVLVYSGDDYSGEVDWSPEVSCPRHLVPQESDPSKVGTCDTSWNPDGDGLTQEDINFPIFIVKSSLTAQALIDCHDEHNIDGQYPYCATQLKARMQGAVSTETCMRRNNLQNNLTPAAYCDELGGLTIISTLQPTNQSSGIVKDYILVTATLDSRSFEMTTFSPGANSATGFISLLAVAQALGNLDNSVKSSMSKNVMFVLYNGEAFDNMGSGRMVYDMKTNQFPSKADNSNWYPAKVTLSQIAYILEFGQLGLVESKAWMHHDPESAKQPDIAKGIYRLKSALNESSTAVSFANQSVGIGLVPSSLESVLAEKSVPGVVLTDFDKAYVNKHFFSRYDTLDKLGIRPNSNATEKEALVHFEDLAQKLSSVATASAQAIYELATGKKNDSIDADTNTIARMLYCYLYRANCTLFKEVMEVGVVEKLENRPFNRYVGVYRDATKQEYVYFAHNLLAYFTGDKSDNMTACEASDSRDKIFKYLKLQGDNSSICVQTTALGLEGKSPATLIDNYDPAKGPYGWWSESRWSKTAYNLRMFLVQDKTTQGVTLLVGFLMLFLSLFFVKIVQIKSKILFTTDSVFSP